MDNYFNHDFFNYLNRNCIIKFYPLNVWHFSVLFKYNISDKSMYFKISVSVPILSVIFFGIGNGRYEENTNSIGIGQKNGIGASLRFTHQSFGYDWFIFLLTQLKKKVLLVNGSVLLKIHPDQTIFLLIGNIADSIYTGLAIFGLVSNVGAD